MKRRQKEDVKTSFLLMLTGQGNSTKDSAQKCMLLLSS